MTYEVYMFIALLVQYVTDLEAANSNIADAMSMITSSNERLQQHLEDVDIEGMKHYVNQ